MKVQIPTPTKPPPFEFQHAKPLEPEQTKRNSYFQILTTIKISNPFALKPLKRLWNFTNKREFDKAMRAMKKRKRKEKKRNPIAQSISLYSH